MALFPNRCRHLSVRPCLSLLVLAAALGGCSLERKPAMSAELGCQLLAHAHGMAAVSSRVFVLGDAQASALLDARSKALQQALSQVRPSADSQGIVQMLEEMRRQAEVLGARRETLQAVRQAMREIQRQSSDLLETSEILSAVLLKENAPATEVYAAGHLVMLTQRLARSATELFTPEGVSPESLFLLGKDVNSFNDLLLGLRDGNSELRLKGTRSEGVRPLIAKLLETFAQTREAARLIQSTPTLEALVQAREAEAAITADSMRMDVVLTPQCVRSSGR